jgi:ubiquinone/menaquinone biosynthesis C-methylase UbiE
MTIHKRTKRNPHITTSWDPVAAWYDGWVGQAGSKYHRTLAIPAILELLDPQPGERILDVGAGQGVLAPYIAQERASYVGVDASPRLLQMARKHHRQHGTFLLGDARSLHQIYELEAGSFDAAVFLLSIQDMDPLPPVLSSAAWALRPGGRIVILMTHPCFRIPRQSGWGWDAGRKLQFRRIDRYLTKLAVPMKSHGGRRQGSTRSFHRPLHEYINGLANHGLLVDCMREVAGDIAPHSQRQEHSADTARDEIPLFLALRAVKNTA